MRKEWEKFEDDRRYRPTTVYRYFDVDGKLLYIGKSWNFHERDAAHRQRGRWRNFAIHCHTEEYISEDIALLAEAWLIQDYKPPFNVKMVPASKLRFGLTRWFDPEIQSVTGADPQWWHLGPGLYDMPKECECPEWADISPLTMEVLYPDHAEFH